MTGEGGCVFNSLLRERVHGKIPPLAPPSQLVLATTEALTPAPPVQVVLAPSQLVLATTDELTLAPSLLKRIDLMQLPWVPTRPSMFHQRRLSML